jgi:hypothetical protein
MCLAAAASAVHADAITTATGAGADAYIELGDATTNYGSDTEIDVKDTSTSSNGLNRKGYIRFDLSSLTAPVTTASLAFTVSVNNGGGTPLDPTLQGFRFDIYGLNDGSTAGGGILGGNWAENAIDWNNAPANIVSGAGASDTVQTGTGTTDGGQAVLLGTFAVTGPVGTQTIALSGGANSSLVDFLNESVSKTPTFIITRYQVVSPDGVTYANANSAFASKEDGVLNPPTLYVNQTAIGVHSQSVLTDSTWRCIGTAPSAGWNTEVSYDDSDAAGWQSAYNDHNNNIWLGSTESADSPSPVWFRDVFNLDAAVISATGDFYFDDYGSVYINGTLVDTRSSGGAGSSTITLNPSLFVVGENLIAVEGKNASAPDNSIADEIDFVVVPEPSGLAMLLMPALLLLCRSRQTGRLFSCSSAASWP